MPEYAAARVLRGAVSLTKDNTVSDALQIMLLEHIGSIPILKNDLLIGVYTERDVLRDTLQRGHFFAKTRLEEVMTKEPYAAYPETPLIEAIGVMINQKFRRLFIADETKELLAVMTLRDCIATLWVQYLKRIDNNQVPTLGDIISEKQKEVFSATPQTIIKDAITLMWEKKIGALPIFEGEQLVGIFTERDLVMRVLNQELNIASTAIEEVMTRNPHHVAHDLAVMDGLEYMHKGGYRHIFIRANDGSTNILSHRDIVEHAYYAMQAD